MNVLVIMGSFKDVFSPIETAEVVASALERYEVACIPMCDGGEYTYDVLKYHKDCKEIIVRDVINPYGTTRDSKYLVINGIAYVIASEILRLGPTEERYKNPICLSDYGLGQLCKDAIAHGYKKINLCLGGTSTVGFGMGFAQALGARFIDREGSIITKPITPMMLDSIERIERGRAVNAKFTVINDGVSNAHDLSSINPQKVGALYSDSKEEILKTLDKNLNQVCDLTGVSIEKPYAGNAGGVCFGVELVTRGCYVKGTEYFLDYFGARKAMEKADLIITGEGKLDNLQTEKLPVTVCKIAKQMKKDCLYICGQIGKGVTHQSLDKYGINNLICCSDFYADIDADYVDEIETYKRLTPLVIRKELKRLYG